MRAIAEFIALIAFGGTMWFGLSRVNWIDLLQVKKVGGDTEEAIADLALEQIKANENIITDKELHAPVDSLISALCAANSISPGRFTLHLVQNDQINAFALPDGHIVVYSGLITAANSQEELAGVLAHELAHHEKGHIMDKLAAEMGLAVLFSITTGNAGSEALISLMKHLSSTAYSREMEEEADRTAVDYLLAASVDPAPFADLLYRIGKNEDPSLSWLNTHPGSEERARTVLDHTGKRIVGKKEILTQSGWLNLKRKISEL